MMTTDEDYAVKKKKELVVRLREGTIIEFLDEFELMLDKYIKHRSILERQRRAALEFSRNRR